MGFRWLKNYMPKGIYGRAALIVIVPMVTVLAIMTVIFVQRHYEQVAGQMAQNMALELDMVLTAIEEAPDIATAQKSAAALAGPLRISFSLPAPEEDTPTRKRLLDVSGQRVIETLKERVPGVVAVDLVTQWRLVTMWTDTRHGPVKLWFARTRVAASNPHQFLVLVGFSALIMSLIAFLFLRNQMRPIRRLSRAAEAFGRGRVVPYRPSGATEVRAAGSAFLDMRGRIERHIEQRTLMLSGVSHDMRTPLTRMRLALSMCDDEETRDELSGDIDEMERLLDEFLAYSRADAMDEPERVSLPDFLRHLIAKQPGAEGRVESCVLGEEMQAMIRPAAMERAVGNLLGNALRYASTARLTAQLSGKSLIFRVEDDGVGIASGEREAATHAFVRLDPSRNQDRGSGVGLGLAITKDIARRSGGTLRLGESEEMGGLMAEIVLPR